MHKNNKSFLDIWAVKNVEFHNFILDKSTKNALKYGIIELIHGQNMVKSRRRVNMPRRGENIRKRKDGRWEGRYIESYDINGKAKYKSVYAHTYSEVRTKILTHTNEGNRSSINISVASWVTGYLEKQKPKLKLSTIKLYERYINNYIQPFFKNFLLRKLNKDILQTFVNSMNSMAPSTVKSIFSFLRETLKSAYKSEYIMDIWVDVELPHKKRHEVAAFTMEEQKLIENSLSVTDNPNDIGIWICLYTGLRIGEVCGLRWKDIDFMSGTMSVNRTMQRMTIDGKSVLKELAPKSMASQRKIPVPSFLVKTLKQVKQSSSTPYVLCTGDHAMDPRTFQYQYKKMLERAGVKYHNAHTLRHTFSVRALETGFDIKTLSEILGHSDATITLKTYAHSLDEHKRNSMERLGTIRN